MSKAIEDTLKALTDFESQLDVAKSEALDAKKQMLRRASEWAEAARGSAISEARSTASETISNARKEAEAEAGSIRAEGEASLKSFERTLASHRSEAAELVRRRLLGEDE